MNEYSHVMNNKKSITISRQNLEGIDKVLSSFDSLFSQYVENKTINVLDIGSACGDSTVVLAALLNEGSKIIVFEPSREIHPYLLNNLSKNPYVSYDIYPVAAGDKFDLVDFVYGIDNGGILDKTLLPERGECLSLYKVQTVHTYTYLKSLYSQTDLDKIQFIKIDTEGYDYIVLRSLAPLIYRNRMPIIVEWWNEPSNSNRLFDVIDSLYYEAFNSLGEKVNRFDFSSTKRTSDLILKPI